MGFFLMPHKLSSLFTKKSKYLVTNDLMKDCTVSNVILRMNLQNLVLEYF
jgi:hypothetical protein